MSCKEYNGKKRDPTFVPNFDIIGQTFFRCDKKREGTRVCSLEWIEGVAHIRSFSFWLQRDWCSRNTQYNIHKQTQICFSSVVVVPRSVVCVSDTHAYIDRRLDDFPYFSNISIVNQICFLLLLLFS
jgi:hypothetical protein